MKCKVFIIYREYRVRGNNYSKEESVRIAGDPLEHDIIICFGNESVHWYSVLIDNRIGKKKVIIINFPLHTLFSLILRE